MKPGDKVRMTQKALDNDLDTPKSRLGRSRMGRVVSVYLVAPFVRVRRYGRKKAEFYHQDFWEVV